jgi:hypothetical protein
MNNYYLRSVMPLGCLGEMGLHRVDPGTVRGSAAAVREVANKL